MAKDQHASSSPESKPNGSISHEQPPMLSVHVVDQCPDEVPNIGTNGHEEVFCNGTQEDERHWKLAREMSVVASSCFNDGEYDKALHNEEQAMGIRSRLLGESHPESLASMNRVIQYCAILAKFSQARALADKLEGLISSDSGNTSLQTIELMINKSSIYYGLGDFKEAEKYCEKAMSLSQDFEGDQSIYHIRAMDIAAQSYFGLGKYEEALSLGEEVVRLSQAQLLPNHHLTLVFRCHLSIYRCVFTTNHCPTELEYARETLQAQTDLLGRNHPETLASMQVVASFYFYLGQLKIAHEMIQKVVAIREHILGPLHPETLSSKTDEMTYLSHAKDFDKASKLGRSLIQLYQDTLGNDHPDTLCVKTNVADLYCLMKEYEGALNLIEGVVSVQSELLGVHHHDTEYVMERADAYRKLVRSLGTYKLCAHTLNRSRGSSNN
jgi:tetratricopeptide (TPR) repeat protein